MNRRQAISKAIGAGGALAISSSIQATTDLDSEGSNSIDRLNSKINSPQAIKPPTLINKDLHRAFVDTKYGQIYYWAVGQGPAVLFIHQSGNSSQEYESLIPLIKDRCRMVALDLPGHGRSDDPKTEPTVEDYTNAAEQVLNHLKVEQAHIVGHHGGALTAMNLAARNPDRFDKLILSGTGGLKTAEQIQKFIDSLNRVDTTIRTENDFVAKTWDRYVAMRSDGADLVDVMRPYIAFLDARLKPYRGVMVNLKWDRSTALKKLRGPVLLLQGSKDEYVSGQESLLEIIPQSTRIELPGCGTFMFYDKPKKCAEVISDYLEL